LLGRLTVDGLAGHLVVDVPFRRKEEADRLRSGREPRLDALASAGQFRGRLTAVLVGLAEQALAVDGVQGPSPQAREGQSEARSGRRPSYPPASGSAICCPPVDDSLGPVLGGWRHSRPWRADCCGEPCILTIQWRTPVGSRPDPAWQVGIGSVARPERPDRDHAGPRAGRNNRHRRPRLRCHGCVAMSSVQGPETPGRPDLVGSHAFWGTRGMCPDRSRPWPGRAGCCRHGRTGVGPTIDTVL
jgi:hypothetical protein